MPLFDDLWESDPLNMVSHCMDYKSTFLHESACFTPLRIKNVPLGLSGQLQEKKTKNNKCFWYLPRCFLAKDF